MSQSTRIRGLTNSEYDAFKAALKVGLPFKHSVRIHRQKYCAGQVDIGPVTENGVRQFSREQVGVVRAWIKANGYHQKDALDPAFDDYCFMAGVNFISKIVE